MSDRSDVFGEVIFSYTREQAIADGVLVDMQQEPFGQMAREAGVRLPIAMTATAFGQYVDLSEAARRVHNDIMGRWWDVLVMFHHAAQRSLKANTIRFEFLCVTDRPRPSKCQLKAVCGPDDEGAPCLTFMLPEED